MFHSLVGGGWEGRPKWEGGKTTETGRKGSEILQQDAKTHIDHVAVMEWWEL